MSADSTKSNATRNIIIAVTLVGLAAIAWTIADVFVIGFGAVVFASILRAMVEPLSRTTGWSHRTSLALVVIALVIAVTAMSWLFGKQAAQQFAQMGKQLPAAAQEFKAWLGESQVGRMVVDAVKDATQEGSPLAGAGTAMAVTLGGIAHLLLILFAAIYLAADPPLYRNGALRLLPPARRKQVGCALDDAGTALHKWLLAQMVVMAAVGLMTGSGLALLGVPLALSLGLLAGLLEFVPVVGPIVATIPGVLLAFTKGPQTALYVLLLYIVVQQVESNILTPLMQRWAVKLPPVLALLSIVAAGLLFGVMGVIFATPMAVVVVAMVKHLYVEDTLENGKPQAADRGVR